MLIFFGLFCIFNLVKITKFFSIIGSILRCIFKRVAVSVYIIHQFSELSFLLNATTR